jgi:signal transduction histidine kinase
MFDRIFVFKLLGIGLFFIYMFADYNEVVSELVTGQLQIFSTYGYGSFLLASASLGIIFSAVVYNLAFYLFNPDRRYLYYSLAQLSMLLFLVTLDSLYIKPFSDFFYLKSIFLHDLSQILIVVFSLLFAVAFLDLPKKSSMLYRLIQGIWVVMAIDFLLLLWLGHAILVRLLPPYIFIWLVVSESRRRIKEKNRAYWFFFYGWYFVIFVAVLVFFDLVVFIGEDFPYLHLAAATEAMVMSLAISYQMKLKEEERQKQQSLLLHQSRLASMGEMITMIAHQWRQPLTRLSYLMMHLKKSCGNNPKAMEKILSAKDQIRFMSNTIDTFRDFYRPSKMRENFQISHAIQKILQIFVPGDATLEVEIIEDFHTTGNLAELEQAILNLLNNAKEALQLCDRDTPTIKIRVEHRQISISDNAGGIPKQMQREIFDPYVSTKKGSDGIGLYIVKLIIEREFGGTVQLKSDHNGSSFILNFPPD